MTTSTVSRLSPLTLALESAWQQIQTDHPEIPNVVIVVGPVSMERGVADRYGHFAPGRWTYGSDERAEVLISAEGLDRTPRQIFRTLLHESVHAWHAAKGVQGTTVRGIHNRAFMEDGQRFGLVCEWNGAAGCANTDITDHAAEHYASAIDRIGRATRTYRRQENAAYAARLQQLHAALIMLSFMGGRSIASMTGGDGPRIVRTRTRNARAGSQTVKLECGCRSIRVYQSAAKLGPITCGACGADFS